MSPIRLIADSNKHLEKPRAPKKVVVGGGGQGFPLVFQQGGGGSLVIQSRQ